MSTIAGRAAHTDRNLHNPWGVSTAPGLRLWVSDHGAGVSNLYDGPTARSPTPLEVTIGGGLASVASATGTP